MLSKKLLTFVLIIGVISFSTCKNKDVTFVQLCDTQLGMGGYEHDKSTFKQAVEQINEIAPDFVVVCGDLVHHAADSSFNDYLTIRNQLNMPCYEAPGNHDIAKEPNTKTLEYYRSKIGSDYFSFEKNGFSFIIVNTQLWKSNVYQESNNHDEWFINELQNMAINNSPVIIFGHYPLYTEDPNEDEHYFNLPVNKRKELLAAFSENNVMAYLSGHKHERIINTYENIQLVTGETTSKNFDNRPFGFRVWNLSSDTAVHHFVPLNFNDE